MVIVYGTFTATAKLLARLITARVEPCVASRYASGRAALAAEAGHRTDAIINWGVKLAPTSPLRCINRNAGIDKREQMRLLHASYVRIPRTIGINTDVIEDALMVRKHIQSSGGQGVSLVQVMQPDDDHIHQEMIEKRAEFRVHVYGTRIVCVTRKYPREDGGVISPHIWNHGNGYVQRTVTKIGELMDESLSHVALLAVRTLGYDFGAVDIAMGLDGALYVLEVNSAPSLCDERAELWVDAITGTERSSNEEAVGQDQQDAGPAQAG